ncbi:hypothetical protein [Henriciella marina]|uniref:hypothetical protein n=1 Tax=Henriciella marina TaxID=453851 RepID=UPI0003705C6A|nr:hypothetical protein [Henriciella marina]
MKYAPGLIGLSILLVACGDDDGTLPPPPAPPAPEESPARVEPAADAPSVSIDDFEPLLGDGWQGQLVYADPDGDDGRSTTPADLSVSRDDRTLTLDFSFPGAPQGDGSAPLEFSEDGSWINDERILVREPEGDGLIILTRQECIEGRYIATCEYLYEISENAFSIAKAYRIAGEEEQRFGHQYSFER